MWICLNNAFFSVVSPVDQPDHLLLVRARRKGDIEEYFPGHKVEKTVGRDYLYRALVPRHDVAERIAEAVKDIGYSNFKDSVHDNALHASYFTVWHAMARVQPIPPYTRRGRQKALEL